MIRRLLLLPATLVAAALVTGCSSGTEPDVAAPNGPTAAPAPSPDGTAAALLIEATFAGGQVRTAQSRVAVPLGGQVVLRVTSDVAEQIHVHGYDRYLTLEPGVPAELTFTADLPGAYEVELHDAGRPLLQLRVA